MGTLILRLPASDDIHPDTRARFCVSNPGSEPTADASALCDLPRGHELIAVIPASRSSWHRARIPPGIQGDKSLRMALEGALEESLLDEPESMHFAIRNEEDSGSLLVGACDKPWITGCLEALAKLELAPTRIVSEFEPGSDPFCWAYLDEALGERMAISWPDAVHSLPIDAAHAPAGFRILCEPGLEAQTGLLQADPLVMGFAQRMAQQAQSDFDWAQFDFATRGHRRWLGPALRIGRDAISASHWRSARLGLLALAIACPVWLFSTAWALSNKAESAERELRAATTAAFPSIKLVLDAPTQATRELSALRSASGLPGPSDMEPLLAALGSAKPTPAPASLSYQAGSLSFPCDEPWAQAKRTEFESQGLDLAAQKGPCQLLARSTPQGAAP